MSECLAYCLGGELDGFMEWMMWYLGCFAAVVVGQLGLAQSDDAEPLIRAPFVLMSSTGLVCLFAINGSLALMSFVTTNGLALTVWLAGACAMDDLLDRCATFEWNPAVARQLIHTALCCVALMQVSLYSRAYDGDAHVAELVMRFFVSLGLMFVTLAFRYITRAQLDLAGDVKVERDEDNDNSSVSAVDAVRRCMDVWLGAALVNLLMTIAAVAINIGHDRGDHCRDFHAVVVFQTISGFVAAFYAVMSVVALRTAAGRKPITRTYTLWRGVIPVASATTPPAEP